jgi:6-phosphogluconolactonase
MPNPPEIEVVPDAQALAERALARVVRLAKTAIQTHDQFMVALAGGSTPRGLYSLLVQERLDWGRIHFFWGDERCVPPDNIDSNYRMASDAMLNQLQVSSGNIHRIHGELPAEYAAKEYETELGFFFNDNLPHFDLVLLGLGTDGHTASLFPGTPAIQDEVHWVAPVSHHVPPPPLVDRVTLTPSVINSAANILFLVSGADKARILTQVLYPTTQTEVLPAQLVAPTSGRASWLVDHAAAAGLSLE